MTRRRQVESNQRRMERYASDVAYRERERAYHRERQSRRARTDPPWRKRRDRLHQAWMAANPERVKEHLRHRNAHPLKKLRQRKQNLRIYGLTVEQFNSKLARQGGRCAICGTADPRGAGSWHVDHDHGLEAHDPRGHRGLLCHPCNTALGAFDDSPKLLRAAAAYLQRHEVGSTA